MTSRHAVFEDFGGDDEPAFVPGETVAPAELRERLLAGWAGQGPSAQRATRGPSAQWAARGPSAQRAGQGPSAERIGQESSVRPAGERPLVVAVDGRSASGKSTLAAALADAPEWAVVATDDLAWWHSFFDWTDLLRQVVEPVRRGEAVSFTPPAWRQRGRTGAVEVPAGCSAVVVEGVGSSRAQIQDLIDVAIWVHTPLTVVEAREQERIASGHVSGSLQHDWMTQELRVLADDRPWSRADLVISGTRSDGEQIVLLTQEDG